MNTSTSVSIQAAPNLLDTGSVPAPSYSESEGTKLRDRIKLLLQERDAV